MDTKMRDLDSNSAAKNRVSEPPPYSISSPESHVTQVHPNNTVIQGTTVIQGASVVPALIVTNRMAPGPTGYVCPSCNQRIVTRVERVSSTKTHLWAALLCFLTGCLCVWIPYCVDSCKKTNHYCPNCGAYIGSH